MSHAFIDNSGDYFLELDNEVVVKANVVAELERERIIKLIQKNIDECPNGDDCHYCSVDKVLIARIKGEQK